MTDYLDQIANLSVESDALGRMVEEAMADMQQVQGNTSRAAEASETMSREIEGLERGLSRGLKRAFDGVLLDGKGLSDALRTVTQSTINSVYNAAVSPVTSHLSGLLAQGIGNIMPFANGGAFSQGQVMPFANGGVVNGPTTFPMRGGTGLMGEAGPEAIMPLARGPDGRLGVRTAGGGSPTIVMNISTPDVQSFNRSRGQIAAQMSRALGRGDRNT